MKYFDGEYFKLEDKEENKEVTMSDEEINAKYKRGEIRIVTEQARYPVKTIKDMLDGGDYKLDPEYQRRKRWDNGKKSRLIESFIMNVPLPPIFLYEYDYAKFEVMDGQQRLTSVYDFYSDIFALEGLEYWKELENKKYSELPSEVQKGIDRRYISSVVLLEETAKTAEEAESLKQIVFERLNSGGEKLTPQETRNALYNGKFNQLCIKLSKNNNFRKMWQMPSESDGGKELLESELLESELYRKMEDVELVLRFFAYRFFDKFSSSRSIQYFLDEYLKQANEFEDATIASLEGLFNKSIDIAYLIFGEEAFIPPKYNSELKKPQKSIYDPLMQSISSNIEIENSLLENKDKIKNRKYEKTLNEFNTNGDKLFEGRGTAPSQVKGRIIYFNNLFTECTK